MKRFILISLSLVVFGSYCSTGQGIYIQPGAKMTVSGGGKLITSGGSAGQLTILSDETGTGSLVVDDHSESLVALSGNANVQCYLTTDVWHMISSPIADAVSGVFLNDYLLTSDPTSSDGWGPYIVPVDVPMEVMRGYAAWKPASNPLSEIFSGDLNNGPVSISLTRNDSDPWAGWHLVGNPYPCAIDLNSAGITWNMVDPTAYFYNPTSGNYYAYPHLSSPPINVGGDHSQYVPPMQGFYVHIFDGFTGTTTLEINNTARIHADESFMKQSRSTDDILVLKAEGTQNAFYDMTVVHFLSEATGRYDPGYDAYKLFGEKEAPQIYSAMNGTKLSYNALPSAGEVTIIPLGFSSGLSGINTITAVNPETFKTFSHVYLEDKQEDVIQDLTADPEYTFTYYKDDNENRFQLRFQNSAIGIDELQNGGMVRIWTNENDIYVENNIPVLKPERLYIYDLLGREMFSTELSLNTLDKVQLPLGSGYYVARVVAVNEIVSKKVFIR